MIIETCFVEATEDVELYKRLGADLIGKTISEAIANCKVAENTTTVESGEVRNPTQNQATNVDDWVARLQAECNRQGFSNQKVDNIAGSNTLNGCPTIRIGAKGNLTKLLQEKLSKLGYNTNGVDGIFGNGTYNAVKQFQKNNSLGSDGIVGRETWRKLLGM